MITIRTLNRATAQEVFDQVARHMLTQGKQSLNADRCRYRGDEGTKCAAGCLIADDEYHPDMEGKTWGGIGFGNDHFTLISELQRIHDLRDCQTVSDWPDGLKAVAKRHGLSTDVLDEFPNWKPR